MKAIIVEDSKIATLAVKLSLRKAGIELAFSAFSLGDLAEQLKANTSPVGLAVVDMMLPDGTGVDACDMIWKKHRGLPTIMCTADPVSDDIKAKFGNKIKAYFTKPLNKEKLGAFLKTL